jgi:hypothetical protein
MLELENKKYYVGKTTSPDFRLEQHFNSSGSQWTKKYKPTKILQIIPNCDSFDEDKYTLKYMSLYGIDNVRGGSFCKIKLDNNDITTINHMINGSTDKCYVCGKDDHFANDCNKRNEKCDCRASYFFTHKKYTCLLTDVASYFDKTYKKYCIHSENENKEKKNYDLDSNAIIGIDCDKIEDSRFEEITVFYCSYCQKEFDTLNGLNSHENLCCKSKRKNICYRCGRHGHYISNCYASTHINGKHLK